MDNDPEGFMFLAHQTLIRDFSPLGRIPKFRDFLLSTKRIDSILPYIEGKPVFRLYLTGTDIHTVSQLSSIQSLQLLDLGSSFQLSSIEGIESHTGLMEVRLQYCERLADLTRLVNCQKLKTIQVSVDMLPLKIPEMRNFEIEVR